jgi:hypothetical protein
LEEKGGEKVEERGVEGVEEKGGEEEVSEGRVKGKVGLGRVEVSSLGTAGTGMN